MEYKKEELEKLILNDKISYRKIGQMYGVTDTYIKKKAKELGIKLEVRAKFPDNFKPRSNFKGVKIFCKNCQKEIKNKFYNKQTYCSISCQHEYAHKEEYKKFLNKDEKFKKVTQNYIKFKPDILKEQDHKCAICGNINQWNDKPIVFILDHIDGNAAHNTRDNLRLICPNCDSQLDTYKSKNKNSARKERYLLNYKNK